VLDRWITNPTFSNVLQFLEDVLLSFELRLLRVSLTMFLAITSVIKCLKFKLSQQIITEIDKCGSPDRFVLSSSTVVR
jgi:hypothetical protein